MDPFRGFVSVEIPPTGELLEFLDALARCGADLKLTAPGNVHATLRFLGETRGDRVEPLLSAMRTACLGIPPFRIALRGAGAFPSVSKPRVAWVGIGGAEPLFGIAERMESEARLLGFEPEGRGFSPHVTLARTRSPRELAALSAEIRSRADASFGEAEVREIRLMRSDLSAKGPTYAVIGSAPLSGREGGSRGAA